MLKDFLLEKLVEQVLRLLFKGLVSGGSGVVLGHVVQELCLGDSGIFLVTLYLLLAAISMNEAQELSQRLILLKDLSLVGLVWRLGEVWQKLARLLKVES